MSTNKKALAKQAKIEKLVKDISNHNQTMWIGIIITVLFFWTIIGGIIGLIMAFIGWELKAKKKIL